MEYHNKGIFTAQINFLNDELLTLQQVKSFISNQRTLVFNHSMKITDRVIESEIQEYICDEFFSHNDIVDFLESNNIFSEQLDEIKELRAEAYQDCLELFNFHYNLTNNK